MARALTGGTICADPPTYREPLKTALVVGGNTSPPATTRHPPFAFHQAAHHSPLPILPLLQALQHAWFKLRHRDPTSRSSILNVAKKTMAERRKSLGQGSSKAILAQGQTQGDGGVGVSGAAAESGAAPEEPPTAKAHALAVGQRQASLASLEGMLPSNAEEVDEVSRAKPSSKQSNTQKALHHSTTLTTPPLSPLPPLLSLPPFPLRTGRYYRVAQIGHRGHIRL